MTIVCRECGYDLTSTFFACEFEARLRGIWTFNVFDERRARMRRQQAVHA